MVGELPCWLKVVLFRSFIIIIRFILPSHDWQLNKSVRSARDSCFASGYQLTHCPQWLMNCLIGSKLLALFASIIYYYYYTLHSPVSQLTVGLADPIPCFLWSSTYSSSSVADELPCWRKVVLVWLFVNTIIMFRSPASRLTVELFGSVSRWCVFNLLIPLREWMGCPSSLKLLVLFRVLMLET